MSVSDAIAQSPQGGVGEVVVTARRRAELLQETPVSVTAYGAEELTARGVDDISELGRFTPNVTFDRSSSAGGTDTNAAIFIRGIGQDDYLPTADPSVGVYLDGVYLGRSFGGVVNISDFARVEILRGPQGTLFGRNTIGGAVNLVTVRPKLDEQEGSLSFEYGDDNLFQTDFTINAPISDAVVLRLSGQMRERDGYGRSTFSGVEFGQEKNVSLRGQVLWEASPTLQMVLSGDYYRQDETGPPTTVWKVDDFNDGPIKWYNDLVAPALGEATYGPQDLGSLSDPYTNSKQATPSEDDAEVFGASLNVTWERGAATWSSITSARALNADFGEDNDATYHSISSTQSELEQSQFTQEFQVTAELGRLTFTSGIYALYEKAEAFERVSLAPGLWSLLETLPSDSYLITALPPDLPGFLQTCPGAEALDPALCVGGAGNPENLILDQDIDSYVQTETRAIALYGQGSYELDDKWSVTLGLRLNYEDKDYETTQYRRTSQTVAIPTSQADDSWFDAAPKLGLERRIGDGLIYGSYARSFRSGTFNGRPSTQGAITAVEPETVDSFELGFKSDWLERRLRVNGAAFFNSFENMQIQASSLDNGVPTLLLLNAGQAETYGVELELAARPMQNLTLGANVGWLQAQIIESSDLAIEEGIEEGDRLSKSPEWNAAVSLQYDIPTSIGETSLRLDYAWRSAVFHEITNDPDTREGAYGLLNARLSLRSLDGKWEGALYGKNITDKLYFRQLSKTGGGEALASPARGREVGVSLRRSF